MKVFDDDDRQLELILKRFEDAWDDRGEAKIEEFLPESQLLLRVLVELVGADLELRMAAGQAARVEDYLDRFPLLREEPNQLAELVQLEFELRSRREPKLETAEYLARFGSLAAQGLLGHLPEVRSSGAEPSQQGGTVGQRTAESGRFRLLRPHGEGGLGNVWIAHDEELDREVAVKEIKHKFADDPENRARFLQEVTITGKLQHPGIVSVYGTGKYADGRPFYAMRLVHGKTLRSAIEAFYSSDWKTAGESQKNVQLRRLLGYLLTVCHTTDYAHRQGILHRDIKPANIMIGQYGDTVLLDWGLAKVLHGKDQEPGPGGSADDSPSRAAAHRAESDAGPRTPMDSQLGKSRNKAILTSSGGVIGSPAYMSPEQARGEHDQLTVRADVYSLGATLYSILTNQPPLTGSRSDELLQRAKAADWEPPSKIVPDVSRPLEAICLKAMATDPKLRYASAKLLADDLERFLADEAVQAYQETPSEQLARVARRHRGLLWTAAAALVVTTVLAVTSAVAINHQRKLAAARATEEMKLRSDAENAKARLQRVRSFLVDTLGTPTPETMGRDVRVVSVLKHSVDNLDTHLQNDPADSSLFLDTVARTYLRLGVLDEALTCAEQAVHLLDRIRNQHEREWLAAQTTLAEVRCATGQIYEALKAQTNTAQTMQSQYGLADPETIRALNALAIAYDAAGEPHKVIELLEEPWRQLGEADVDGRSTWMLGVALCDAYRITDRRADALQLAEQLFEFASGVYPEDDTRLDRIRENLALSYAYSKRPDDAISMLQDTYRRRLKVEGPQHPLTMDALSSLGVVNLWTERDDQAIEIFKKVLEIRQARLDDDHPAVLHTMQNLAQAIHQAAHIKQRFSKALALNERTLALAESSQTPDRELILALFNNIATNLYALGRTSEAIAYNEKAADGLRDELGLQHPHTLVAVNNLVGSYVRVGRSDEAQTRLEEAISAARRQHGENYSHTLQLRSQAASIALASGQPAEAVIILQDVVPRCEEHLGKVNVNTLIATSTLRWALIADQQYESAEALARESFVTYKHAPEELAWDIAIAISQIQLAESLLGQGRLPEAEPFTDITLKFLASHKDVSIEAHARSTKAACLIEQEAYEQAEQELLAARDMLSRPDTKINHEFAHTRTVILDRLVQLYEAWDKPARASEFRR